MENALKFIGERILQLIFSIGGGLLLAIEGVTIYLMPSLILVVLDIISALCLSKRIHAKDPTRSDGKFKSKYKYRVMFTMIIIFILLILAKYVDQLIIKDTDVAMRFTMGLFVFYEGWSITENWSSENDNKLAKVFQKIMVNKAERHLNIDLSDLRDEPKCLKDEVIQQQTSDTTNDTNNSELHI